MDLKLFLSIYAAIVSTVVFFWRLYEFYDDKKGKIKVSLAISNELPLYRNNTLGEWATYLVATVTNVGKYKRMIERPQIKVDLKIKGKDVFSIINFDDQANFPITLEPGQKYEYKMPIATVNDSFRAVGVTKVRSIVRDTHSKSYLSKWFAIVEKG
jgi:hypothetical protein